MSHSLTLVSESVSLAAPQTRKGFPENCLLQLLQSTFKRYTCIFTEPDQFGISDFVVKSRNYV